MSEITVLSYTQQIVVDPARAIALVVNATSPSKIEVEPPLFPNVHVNPASPNNVIVSGTGEDQQIIVTSPANAVSVINAGPQGPAGPPGDGGGEVFRYVHTQDSASTLWTIPHLLEGYPQVTAFEGATGDQIEGVVNYVSPFELTITFSAAVSGWANLS